MLNEIIDRSLETLNGIYQLSEQERLSRLSEFFKSTLSITPNIYDPKNLKYLFSYPDPIGVFADFLANYINSNVHTEECSPIFTHCEVEIIEQLLPLVGYSDGDGVFYPGGTLSNLASVVLAIQRSQKSTTNPVVLLSNHCHYSISNAINICGIEKILTVETTLEGVVDLDSLKRAIETAQVNNLDPVYFCCVLGATNLGTFDPVEQIHNIFTQNRVQPWVHFDAAWGGGVYFSPEGDFYRDCSVIADSIVLDFHKFLSAPLLCSALLVKDKSVLQQNNLSENANYLFNSKQDPKYSLSLKSLQCSREAYAFKLWLMFKYHGIGYFENLIAKFYKNQKLFRNRLRDRVLYVVEPKYFNICIWFIPEKMAIQSTILDYNLEERQKIDQFNLAMYEKIATDNFVNVNFSSFNGLPTFIRLIVHHANLTEKIIDEIVSYLLEIYQAIAD